MTAREIIASVRGRSDAVEQLTGALTADWAPEDRQALVVARLEAMRRRK